MGCSGRRSLCCNIHPESYLSECRWKMISATALTGWVSLGSMTLEGILAYNGTNMSQKMYVYLIVLCCIFSSLTILTCVIVACQTEKCRECCLFWSKMGRIPNEPNDDGGDVVITPVRARSAEQSL